MKKILLLLATIAVVLAIVLNLPTPQPVAANNANSFVIGPVQVFDGETWRKEKFVVIQDGCQHELAGAVSPTSCLEERF
ncbi:hypothetical protein [Pseudidiomarina salilacus]|uniref:hypothetical protein n=1 Tax=Pseudidiomarina salilacus TaxID=3384452 RepID=UPI00398532E7